MTDSQKHFKQDYSPTLEKNKLFNKIIKEFFNKDFIYIYIYISTYAYMYKMSKTYPKPNK